MRVGRTKMAFTEITPLLNEGKALTRGIWPDDRFIILVPGSTVKVEADRPLGKAMPRLVGSEVRYMPHIDLVIVLPVIQANPDDPTSVITMHPWESTIGDRHALDWMELIG